MTRMLITTLAEYQTRFWAPVGIALREIGHEPAFLSYDDRSCEMLEQAGLPYYSANDLSSVPPETEWAGIFEARGIDRLNHWFTHERHAFGLTDSHRLQKKLVQSLLATDRALDDFAPGGDVVLIQELGGFLSVIGSYFSARSRGIDNWFIEPSFFRGRLLFLKNRFEAADFGSHLSAEPGEPVLEYIAQTIDTGAIVVPQKDRHQYTTAYRKIVNTKNARRLAEKIVDKYLLGKQQEFGHIGSHVRTHAQMLVNSRKLRNGYTLVDECRSFIYYPLHVPGDMALTLRSPQYLDQLSLIDYLCRCAPFGYRVAVKEHPAMIGAIDAQRLLKLTERYDNLAILPPSTNNYEVLKRAELVVSVNSKSGAEAGLLGKRVLVLGDAFYRRAPFAIYVANLTEIEARMTEQLSIDTPPKRDQINRYFAGLWSCTYPGELYVPARSNVDVFTASMCGAIE